jgi:beta-lactamase regulating signal transducer with metallopeptidase domain/biopolymer transport protein ExbD
MIMIELLNEWSRAWAGYFSTAAIQNTIFLICLFIVLRLLRNASAQLKYVIGIVGLIKLLVPPFLPMHLFGSTPTNISNFVLIPAAGFSSPDLSIAGSAQSSTAGLSYLAFIFILWICSALSYMGLSIASTLRLRSRLRTASTLPEEVSIHPHKSCLQILKSSEIAMPLTLGLFPKRIYLPPAWDKWSQDCRHMVIRHEAAHIRRKDGLFQGIQILTQALYFFHPLVWLLNRRLNEYREMACDDSSVSGEPASRSEYSRTLVEIAETIARDSLTYETASALIRRKNELFNRVHYQLKEEVMRGISKTKTAAIVCAAATFTLFFSWYHTGASPHAGKTKPVLAKSGTNESTRFIDLTISDQEGLLIDGEKVTFETFIAKIKGISPEDTENTVINLDCSNDMPMVKLFTIQEILRKANLTKVSYHNDIGKALPLVLPSEKILERIKEIDTADIARVNINESASVHLDNEKIPVSNLSNKIKRLISNNEFLIISIHMTPATRYEDFIRVLGQVKKGDAKRILINDIKEE